MFRSTGISRYGALVLALVAGPAALFAQSSTTSALAGVVRDPSGKPLSGALVRISSPGMMGGERTTITSENGSYRFPVLPPGRFRIVVEAKGFSTLVGSELLELSRVATVNWKFAASASATVEVVGNSTNLDATPVGVTQNYDTVELATLPVGRDLSSIMNLTPGVNNNYAWGGDRRENVWMMDGINISDPQSNSQWIFPNPDWFSEIQVGGVGAPAEFGGFTGGFINGLLKRGGNEMTGNFSGYYGNNKWEATSTNKDPRFTADDKKLPPASDWDGAISVGGPIIKDKLWYFVSVERKATETTPIGAPMSQRDNELLSLVKLTWQATPNATLEGLYEYDYTTRDRRFISSYTSPDATNKEISPNRSYGLTWTQSIGSDKVLTLKGFGYSGRYDQPGYHGEEYGLDSYDYYNGVEYFHNAMPVDYNYRGRNTLSATFDLFKTGLFTSGDSHAFRMGIEHEWVTDEELERNPGGIGLMGQVGSDESGNPTVLTDYFWTGGGWDIREHATRTSAFIQDTWTVNERLTLRPGLRFEQQQANGYGHPTLWNTSTFAPRLGATYALTADQKNVLKFHWGRFYAAFSASYIDRAYQEMTPPERDYSWGSVANGYGPTQINPYNYATWPMPNPNDPNNPAYATFASLSPTDPNAKQPYMDETMFSFEHKFEGPWSFSATYIYRVNKDNLLRKDMAPDNGSWVNKSFSDYRQDPSGNTKVTLPIWYSTVTPEAHQWLVTTDPDAKRAYWSGSLVLARKFQDNWSLNASYTRARRYGDSSKNNGYDTLDENPNNKTNASGLLPGFNDNEVKINGLYELPWKMRLSGVFTYLSGEHYTPYVRTASINSTRYLPYIEPLGSETYPGRHLLDLRVTQVVAFTKRIKGEVFVECFNFLNSGNAVAWSTRADSSSYLLPSSVESGRRLRLGFRVNF